jgi:2-polyprenyl-6-hydroxyphenyl methylase/3-demethylubiquinone-9 3-methyltransferase
MANANEVNNAIYDNYGDQWYTAVDDPIALLRAENKVKSPWVLSRIKTPSLILDVGCGAGFLTNELALAGHKESRDVQLFTADHKANESSPVPSS